MDHQMVASIKPWKNPGKTCSEVELSKSLALLGFGSWTSLEPKTEREAGEFVKVKLSEALQRKIDSVDEKRKKEEADKKRFEKMTKKEQDDYTQKLLRKDNGLKKKRKTFLEEERDAHEAYQLILSEYHRRVKQRMRAKLSAMHALSKMSKGSMEKPDSAVDCECVGGSKNKNGNKNDNQDKMPLMKNIVEEAMIGASEKNLIKSSYSSSYLKGEIVSKIPTDNKDTAASGMKGMVKKFQVRKIIASATATLDDGVNDGLRGDLRARQLTQN